MNVIKKIRVCFLFIFVTALFAGCSKEDTAPREYTNAGENYALTLSGNWIQDTGASNEDMLVAYFDEEKNMSISIQRYDKEIAKDTMGLDTLERFQVYYQTNAFIAGLYAAAEVTQQDYTMANMTAAVAEELVLSEEDTVIKAFCVVAESENAYYTCTITGEQSVYDKEIAVLKEALSNLSEK